MTTETETEQQTKLKRSDEKIILLFESTVTPTSQTIHSNMNIRRRIRPQDPENISPVMMINTESNNTNAVGVGEQSSSNQQLETCDHTEYIDTRRTYRPHGNMILFQWKKERRLSTNYNSAQYYVYINIPESTIQHPTIRHPC